MRKLINVVCCSLSFLFIIIHTSSCNKNADPNNDVDENYAVAVKFKEFDEAIIPLTNETTAPVGLKNLTSSSRPASSTEEGSLYFWSFNQQTAEPDMAVASGTRITVNQVPITAEFGTGWAYETFVAGQALSITGLTEFIIEIPLTGVSTLSSFGFDIGSSGTGAKNFVLSYSQDGLSYHVLSDNNQFSNTNTSQAKNSFVFQLTDLTLDFNKNLFIKLVPLAGERGTASDYRETTGVLKMDNVRLVGLVGTSITSDLVKRLHYHIFDAITQNIVSTGVYDYATANLADFSLALPAGTYVASFVTNESKLALPMPGNVNASSYFVANTFSNYTAKIFGVLDTFTVSENMGLELTLRRYYSEVKFEFTDVADLSSVRKIDIVRRHTPEFYAPFNSSFSNALADQSITTINPVFTANNKSILFNQFIGNVATPLNLMYTVNAYDAANSLIRSFEVSTTVRNNMQLIFRGALLSTQGTGSNFAVVFNENWSGTQVVDF